MIDLPAIRNAARGCGYAIAEHGSRQRDLDIVAIPWTDRAADAATLVREVAYHGKLTCSDPGTDMPHGRRAFVLRDPKRKPGDPVYVDLSVMPRAAAAKEHKP